METGLFPGIALFIRVQCYGYFTEGFLLVWGAYRSWPAPGVASLAWGGSWRRWREGVVFLTCFL